MATKVLVFESDAAFAGELRSELGKLGCSSQIVDDGNVGLQQAAADKPDLILLSIELPRMNGFSVCNKLKKDPALKDVPLIIMSSESSEETFEQHRKLRTRAEDYVHKPIAFGELLRHIQAFVRLDAPPPGPASEDAAIVIDDDIGAGVELADEEDEGTQIAQRPPEFQRPSKPVDAEVDAFAESAFGRLTHGGVAAAGEPAPKRGDAERASQSSRIPTPLPPKRVSFPPPIPSAPAVAVPAVPPSAPRASMPSMPQAPAGPPPRPSGAEQAEIERLKAEIEKAKGRATELEKELGSSKADVARLQQDMERGSKSDAESQRMQREIDELRAKLASGAKPGGASSRDVLDLREALNKKEKELLTLREAMSKKDREIVEIQDRVLVLERTRSDLDDKVLATERELADARDRIDVLAADKEQAKKAGEDFKSRLTRTQGELEARGKELEEARARHDAELKDRDSKEAALRLEHGGAMARAAEESAEALAKAATEKADALTKAAEEQARALAQAADEKARALDEAEATRQSDLDQALSDRVAALEEAKREAARDKEEALAAREGELRAEALAAAAVAATVAAELLATTTAEHERRAADAAAKHAAEVQAAESRRLNELDSAEALRKTQLESARAEADEMLSAAERDRDDKVAALSRDRDDRIATLEKDRDDRLAAAASELTDTTQALTRDRDAKIAALESDRDARIAQLEEDRDARISRIERDRDERISTLESKAARELADAREQAEAQKSDADQRITGLESDLLLVRGELSDLQVAKRDLDAANAAKLAELTSELRHMTEARDGLDRELAAARNRIASLEVEGSGLRGDLEETRQKLSDETRRADHAFTKWESDKGSLERAKDALAVVLSQIEEAEARAISAS